MMGASHVPAGGASAKQGINHRHHALQSTRGFCRLKSAARESGVAPHLADVESLALAKSQRRTGVGPGLRTPGYNSTQFTLCLCVSLPSTPPLLHRLHPHFTIYKKKHRARTLCTKTLTDGGHCAEQLGGSLVRGEQRSRKDVSLQMSTVY